ncbi:HVO_0649 family zinc finger protein [Haloarchaeobius sp. DFWS5]|uniref:HVO_0649 family zinc finger protein n=1 Tax=Haloarchaeobius sp. DFWS5 TaxID=3446114 RepID=UPI003EBBDC4B
MAASNLSGKSAFDRLKTHYDVDLVCRQCGHEDADGEWKATTNGRKVLYRHVCPSCGSIETRTLSLKSE